MAAAVCKVIGISGVTNGGKTTLSRMLVSALNQKNVAVTHINMDDYYWEEDDPHHVQLEDFDYANWDDVCSVNWPRLLTDVKKWRNEMTGRTGANVLLVEGIMIFNNRDMLACFDHKYFITLSKNECWDRRRQRVYEPPEPEGYFDKIVWPYYLKFKAEISNLSDIVFMDGMKSIEQLFGQLLTDVDKMLTV